MNPLLVFPQIVYLSAFAPTFLRLALGLLLLWSAWQALKNRHKPFHLPFGMLDNRPWVGVFAAVAEALLAAMFIAGWYTQIAALLGMAAALKYALYRRWWPQALEVYFPISAGTAFLMFIICATLLITGAGLMAFDQPF